MNAHIAAHTNHSHTNEALRRLQHITSLLPHHRHNENYEPCQQLPPTYVQELAYFLDHAHPGRHTTGDVAQAGSIICLKNGRQQWQFILVQPSEACSKSHLVSIASPLGRATMGRRCGDIVHIATGEGERAFVVAYVR